MKKSLLTVFIIFYSICCYGWYPVVRNFSKENYKSGAQNWSIVSGEGGSMWFANSGLMEFDGNEWHTYHTRNRTSVRSLMYDEESGRLYFGATDELGYMHISQDNKMEYVSLKDSIPSKIGDIWAIHKSGKKLWLRENNNMYLYDFQSLKQFSFNDKVAISAEIGRDLIIFVNNNGVLKYNPATGFVEIKGTESLRDKRVNAIIPYGNDILFATATSGLFLFSNGKLMPYDPELSRTLAGDNVYCAASNGKYLSFGTVSNGVYIKDLEGGQIIHLNTYSGLQNNTVLSMYYDRNDNLWLGLDKGIDLVELGSPVYRIFGNPNEFGAGYASEIFEGRLWLGTNQGLYVAEVSKGDTPSDVKLKEISTIKGQVWSLMTYEDRLFCCNDKGIHIIRNGRTVHIPMNGAWKLEALHDSPEYLLGCSYDRLFLLKKQGGGWKFDGWLEGFDQASKVFLEDNDGKIWFYHWVNGLFRLTPDIKERKITDVEYFSRNEGFPEDWNNTPIRVNDKIIFHTTDGFYSFDNYSRKAYRNEHINSMFSTPPAGTSMYVTKGGDFFFSSPSLQAYCYQSEDGFVMDTLSLKHIADKRIPGFEEVRDLTDKILLVNTEDGFSVIRTDILKNSRQDTHNDVYVKDVTTTRSGGDTTVFSSRSRQRCESSKLNLPYSHNSLKFTAALPSYTSGTRTKYRFMLENYDSGWSRYAETCSKEYTKLPPGNYRFIVEAGTQDSSRTSETFIDITIRAPWYLSPLAYLVYAVIGILMAYLGYLLVRHMMRIKALQLKKQNEEEMRQRQMHLDLEHKAQDLAASTMNVIRKNEILLDIDSKLEKVVEYIAEDRNRSLKILSKIRQEIKDNIQHDDIWHQFEDNFDIVYNDFLKRLGEKYPKLTVSDKKMCAYLRMNLSSKDIAPLLNMTVRSIEMTRYRIRKKLGLSREDNLTEFLQKF